MALPSASRPSKASSCTRSRPSTYERAHRLELAIALDANGRVLEQQPFRTDSPGVYPCEKPVDQGHGVMMCP
jgi:hypothetical protein